MHLTPLPLGHLQQFLKPITTFYARHFLCLVIALAKPPYHPADAIPSHLSAITSGSTTPNMAMNMARPIDRQPAKRDLVSSIWRVYAFCYFNISSSSTIMLPLNMILLICSLGLYDHDLLLLSSSTFTYDQETQLKHKFSHD